MDAKNRFEHVQADWIDDIVFEFRYTITKLSCPYCGVLPDCKNDKLPCPIGDYYLQCFNCHRRYSERSGLLFSNSKLPYWKFFFAIWFYLNIQRASSYQLAHYINTTQQTGWSMLERIKGSYTDPVYKELFDKWLRRLPPEKYGDN